MKKIYCILLLFSFRSGAQVKCDAGKLPIIFVHGFLASGDTWATQVQRFIQNGYCKERLFVFDWNTFGGKHLPDSLLDLFINKVLQQTGAAKVDLVAHSAGGALCYNYLSDSARSLKVAHYAHTGSSKIKGSAGYKGNLPTINIYSKDDKIAGAAGESGGVKNIALTGKDHLEVATCPETFTALYHFFNDNSISLQSALQPSKAATRLVSGRAVMMGENTPLAGDSIFVYSFDASTGKRMGNSPIQTLVTNNEGYWPSFAVKKDQYLEFEVHPRNSHRVSYYMEPPANDNSFIYLRCLPSTGIAAAILQKLPNDDKQTVMAVFSVNNAIVYGRDTLAIDSIPLSSAALTPAIKTIVATFLFDDGDGVSGGKSLKGMGTGIFISGVDVMLPASPALTSKIFYNGRSMVLPHRPGREVYEVAVFN